MPKDAKQHNKLLTDENKYYKVYDFTDHNQRSTTGILKIIKSKYKQLKLRTYDITFDKTKYDLYVNNDNCAWWKILIYDNNEKNVLTLSKKGVSFTQKKKNLYIYKMFVHWKWYIILYETVFHI